MSTQPDPTNPRREHASTYFVQDRSNQEELSRLQVQDQMLTRGMGGVLPEQPDPTIFHRVLDVGCGTGNWLIEAARTYPTMSLLIGIDISNKMVEIAREQAKAQQVNDRVEFHVMDALRALEFSDNYFDLVNLRLKQPRHFLCCCRSSICKHLDIIGCLADFTMSQYTLHNHWANPHILKKRCRCVPEIVNTHLR